MLHNKQSLPYQKHLLQKQTLQTKTNLTFGEYITIEYNLMCVFFVFLFKNMTSCAIALRLKSICQNELLYARLNYSFPLCLKLCSFSLIDWRSFEKSANILDKQKNIYFLSYRTRTISTKF